MSCDRAFATDGVDDEHDAEAWRAVGAWFARSRVDDTRWEMEEALHTVSEKLEDGERLTRADIDAIREAKDAIVSLTEEHLVHLADGVEPWDAGVGMCVPYGVMRRQIEQDDFPPQLYHQTDDTVTDAADESDGPGASGGGETDD